MQILSTLSTVFRNNSWYFEYLPNIVLAICEKVACSMYDIFVGMQLSRMVNN